MAPQWPSSCDHLQLVTTFTKPPHLACKNGINYLHTSSEKWKAERVDGERSTHRGAGGRVSLLTLSGVPVLSGAGLNKRRAVGLDPHPVEEVWDASPFGEF